MKFLILFVCLLYAITGESVELRRQNGKGTKRSASSARGKPQLFRVDPNVCVCLDEDGIIVSTLPPVDPCVDITCDAHEDIVDFLTFNCYVNLMRLEENPDLKWDTIRDDILRNGVKAELNVEPACLLELVPMVKADEKRIQETPKFQATIRKMKIKGELEDYRSSPVIVDIVGPMQVSDITVAICFKDPKNDEESCSYTFPKSFDKQISHAFASKSWTSWDEGAVKVMGELLRSEATFTAKARKINLKEIGEKMHAFLGQRPPGKRIADIVITFTASRLDVKETHATAKLNTNGDIVMIHGGWYDPKGGDIIIGGMDLENFND